MKLTPVIQGWFNICKSVNVILYKNHMIISIDTEKANKIQNPFMIKMLNKLITEGMYLNIMKSISDKPTDNIILKSKKILRETQINEKTLHIHKMMI